MKIEIEDPGMLEYLPLLATIINMAAKRNLPIPIKVALRDDGLPKAIFLFEGNLGPVIMDMEIGQSEKRRGVEWSFGPMPLLWMKL